ncbi:MAG: IS1182 family transposase [Clostridiaceae bacterium]|nr:IS1182 family transposase [Clostridiaceae bacterium]
MRYIEGIHRKSKIALPEYVDDYVTEDNPVRIIDAFVETLDVGELGFKNATPKKRGRPGYNPKDLLKLYIYGYMNKVISSKKLEKQTQTNIEVMWLLRRLTPDDRSIYEFRKNNKHAINEVFKHFTSLLNQWDLFGKEVVAVDGSKFRACNSKKNNFSSKTLNRKIKYLEEKIQKYMTEIEENDIKELNTHKPTKEEIQAKIKELKERKKKYEGYKDEIEKSDIKEISTTDSESRLMAVNNNGIDICYNIQTVVDSKHKLVVDCDIINNPTDHCMLSKIAGNAKEIFDVKELKALADKGYYNATDLKECEQENIYLCPQGEKLYSRRQKPIDENTKEIVYQNFEACGKCDFKDKCTKDKRGRQVRRPIDQDFLDRVDQRTAKNKDLYKQRQMIVEHPFGTIKRGLGMTYFLTKGMQSAKAEISFAFLSYNMKRVINILGVKEIIKRLTGKKGFVSLQFHKYAIFLENIS